MDRTVLADTVGLFAEIIRADSHWNLKRHSLLEKCRALFRAEACSVFLVRERVVALDAHVGYTRADGSTIPFEDLQKELTYEITPRSEWGLKPFDGITGLVASRGEEFCADSWEEIKCAPSHAGKPDHLGIWDPSVRPFRCMLAVPLMIGTKVAGVLKVENKTGGTFDAVDRELARKLASLFSIAVGHGLLDRSPKGWVTGKPSPQTPGDRRKEILALARRHDLDDMATVIERFPGQIDYALSDPNLPTVSGKSFDKVLVVGMGGSALPVEVLNDAFRDRLNVPVLVSRYYSPLSSVSSQTLIIASSFSGNTEETLSALESLPADSANIVVLTAGGRLAEIAAERRYPMIRIPYEREPQNFQPRCATGYMVTYLARLLAGVGVLNEPEPMLKAVVDLLRGLDVRSEAESVAYWFGNRIPVFYTDVKHEGSIARVAKIKHNENAKRPAFFNSLPEANHNEMIGFASQFGRFAILYMRDPDSPPQVHRRFNVMRKVFSEKHVDHGFREWAMPGSTTPEKVFAALMFSDWCSYTLGLLAGVNPTPVDLVEDFKKTLEANSDQPRRL